MLAKQRRQEGNLLIKELAILVYGQQFKTRTELVVAYLLVGNLQPIQLIQQALSSSRWSICGNWRFHEMKKTKQ